MLSLARVSFKKISIFMLPLMLVLSSSAWAAGTAQPFVGWYHIVSERKDAQEKELGYLLVDRGTLQEIWDKYADSEMPADLQQYRNEMTILAGFTHREFLMLSFEAISMITDRYLRLQSGSERMLEIYRQDDGSYLLGTRENGVDNRYLMSAPTATP